LAIDFNNLAQLLMAQGEFAKARPYYERALAMNQALYPKERYPRGHPYLAASLGSLATLLKKQGEYALAATYNEQAVAICESLYPKERYPRGHRNLATALNSLGYMLEEQGEHAKALPYFERGLTINEALYSRDRYPHGHADLAYNLINRGLQLDLQGEHAKALAFCERALTMYEDLTALFLAGASEAQALNHLAELPASRDTYLSVSRHGGDAEAAYLHVWRGKGALARSMEDRRVLRPTDPDARALADRLADTRHALAGLVLAPAGSRLRQAELVREWTDRKEDLERRLAVRIPALAQLRERDRQKPADLAAILPPQSVFIDWTRYDRLTEDPRKPGHRLIVRTPCYVAFVVQTGQPARRIELGEAGPIEEALEQWRTSLSRWRPGETEDRAAALALRRRLWEPLMSHFPANVDTVYLGPDGVLTGLPWAALPGARPGTVLLEDHALVLVPHPRFLIEQLQARPPTPSPDRVLVVGGVRYDRAPTPAPSNADAPLALRGAASDTKLLWPYLAGTEAELEQVRVLAGKRSLNLLRGQDASTTRVRAELPQARWAHLSTHGFFADHRFRSFLGVDEGLFQVQERAPVAPAVGLAAGPGAVFTRPVLRGRSTAGMRNPLVLSGLVLSGANLQGKDVADDRGILTAEAVAGLSLDNLELAVLSACETGLGQVAGGEGVFGLQRAFHIAGTRNVIATLWKVDDEATAALMALFYHYLWTEGKPPREALRQAQLTLYRESGRISPLAKLRGPDLAREVRRPVGKTESAQPGARAAAKLWAGFTLSGSGR
jgi:CHAT domain-containing protein